MTPLDHFAEPFSPTGSLASEGVRNQLGRPRKDPVEVLIREALQNCWDAKRKDAETVDVSIRLERLDPATISPLFDSSPAESGAPAIKQSTRVLIIADRGTSGLGGVLRADNAEGQQLRNFVDFLRNIGQPPDTDRGGGTYGYGKVALFGASKHRTIFVHSGCRHGRNHEVRFMLARLGNQYAAGGTRYTGRHWWGRLAADDNVIDPVLNGGANEIAAKFGLPPFDTDEFGTTIGILDPDFDGLTDQDAGRLIAECVAWNFWPKLLELRGAPPAMTVEVAVNGAPIPVPSAKSDPRLGAFAEAHEILKSGSVDDGIAPFADLSEMKCGNPKQVLGCLALLKHPATPKPVSIWDRSPSRPRDRVRHVCLLRTPELVVKYLEVAESPAPTVDYAGVFLVNDDLDRVFAQSEPPTHDDWVPDGLADSHHRTFVRVAERRIQEAAKRFVEPIPGTVAAIEGTPLAEVSDLLGRLLPNPSGGGGPIDTPIPRPHTPGRRKASVSMGEPALVLDGLHRGLDVPFEVSGKDRPVDLVLKAGVVLDTGGVEKEPPAGAERPEAVLWVLGGEPVEERSPGCIRVVPPFPRKGRVRVRLGSDAALRVSLLGSEAPDHEAP